MFGLDHQIEVYVTPSENQINLHKTQNPKLTIQGRHQKHIQIIYMVNLTLNFRNSQPLASHTMLHYTYRNLSRSKNKRQCKESFEFCLYDLNHLEVHFIKHFLKLLLFMDVFPIT